MFHACHERPLDDLYCLTICVHCFLEITFKILGSAFDDGLDEPFLKRFLASLCLGLVGCCLSVLGCHHCSSLGNQSFSRLGIAVENHILHTFEKLRLDLVIDLKHGWVDDRHIHSCLDCMIKEGRMHGFTHGIIASERKGKVGYTT